MRFRVAADIGLVPVTEYETVLMETPATRATSEMVAMSPLTVAIKMGYFLAVEKIAPIRILESIRPWYASPPLFGTNELPRLEPRHLTMCACGHTSKSKI